MSGGGVADGYVMAFYNISFLAQLVSLFAQVIIASGVVFLTYIAYRIYDHMRRPFPRIRPIDGLPFGGGTHIGAAMRWRSNMHSFPIVDEPDPAPCAAAAAAASASQEAEAGTAAAASSAADGERSSDEVAAAPSDEHPPSSDAEEGSRRVGPCMVCRTGEANFVIRPCNHFGMCRQCTGQLAQRQMARCPQCRGDISGCERVHFA